MSPRLLAAMLASTLGASLLVSPVRAVAADDPTLPSRTSVLASARAAADYYRGTYATTTLTPRNGWSWATYFEGVHDLYAQTGDARYQADGMAWGRSNSWGFNTTERNPDTLKAGQDYVDLNRTDSSASLTELDSHMRSDLTGMPVSQYDWVDALFMGLPNWATWAGRTGDTAYLDKLDALFTWMRDQGTKGSRCGGRTPSQPGLYDASAGLWYRDCSFVGAKDPNGKPVFWGRGNGWVVAAMADVLRALPAGDPRGAPYAQMLRTMAASLAPLQGTDGFWRPSLANPARFPQGETSGTALITYALAYGVRTGVLDRATYLPVIAKAWRGMTSVALRPGGFVTNCQGQGTQPATPYTATAPATAPTSTSSGTVNSDSPPFCVGAFLMAGAQVAQIAPAVTTYASDTFARTTSNGFGAADSGGAWSLTGSASVFSVSGGLGRMKLGKGVGVTALLPAVSARDVDLRVDTGFDKAASGTGAYVSLVARRSGRSDYRVQVKKVASGAITLSVNKVVDGTESTLAKTTVPGLVAGTSDTLRVRLAVTGSGTTSLRAKAWKVTSTEPTSWQVTASDSTSVLQGPGAVGLWSYLSGSATNAPLTTLVDNLTATTP